jgi:hypothetical protein
MSADTQMSLDRRRVIGMLASITMISPAEIVMAASEPANTHPLLAFAVDISRNDAKVRKTVTQWLKTPPTRNEDIGFHGDVSAMPPALRQWLATVSVLGNNGFHMSFEDKYTNEAITIWEQTGLFDSNAFPQPLRDTLAIMRDGADFDDDGNGDKAAYDRLWNHYGATTMAIETAMREKGKALISIDATEGDTMFFAVVDPVIADRWVGTGFATTQGFGKTYEAGVRLPMWDRWWHHLLYSIQAPDDAFGGKTGLPPGTRERAKLKMIC